MNRIVVSSWPFFVLLVVNTGLRTNTLKVIGGKRTVILGEDADLFCRLSEAEEFDQITWQKETRENPNKHNFFVIQPNGITKDVDGLIGRVLFIGNTSDYLGSIRIRNVMLLDEGTYTCIFSVSSGPIQTEMSLTVIVPPVMSVTGHVSPVGDNEVVLVTCIAAAAKPKAEVIWDTGALNKSLRWVTNSTQHANGTSTVLSQLIGLPTRTANQKQVQCVVNQSALEEERTLSYTIDIHYPPQTVNINASSQDKYFLCVGDGNPKPNYIWSRDVQPWPGSSVRTDGDTLHLLSLSSDLNGLYVCEASNLYGSTTGSLYIHITSDRSRLWWRAHTTTCDRRRRGRGGNMTLESNLLIYLFARPRKPRIVNVFY
ncbi:nectin-3-like isoform X2 [Esox lucius]|uniref:nectin-3-like isoform X2 n=1 Tax=Esox lucius TaxID=8010 RepID=UPI00097348EF|nr:nectin-3-like isoform X2 [Esox lucius]